MHPRHWLVVRPAYRIRLVVVRRIFILLTVLGIVCYYGLPHYGSHALSTAGTVLADVAVSQSSSLVSRSELALILTLVMAVVVHCVRLKDMAPLERQKKELGEMLATLRHSRDEVLQRNEQLTLLANRDPLTGCLNRRSFFDRFESQWNSARRYNQPLSCIMLDIDHFKQINDTHGHAAGDAVLKQVAQLLLASARKSDEICRFGGEEFCLLLPQTNLQGAELVARETLRAISSSEFSGLSITASLGVSAICQGAASPDALIDQADRCLYAAKRSGRNCVVCWNQMCPKPHSIRRLGASAEAHSG